MVDTIYIEAELENHHRVEKICRRYPKAKTILINHYGEVFNSKTQNFRLQKQNPALILAKKQNKRVLDTPAQYETGGGAHYYFSHMLNCVYDCRYCFLQGMLRSANYLLFVNYEDFVEDIRDVATTHESNDKATWFFSGYDCDSLAYEPVTGFAEYFVEAFKSMPNAVLELRTKSTQVRQLLKQPAQDNVVVAFSLSPGEVAASIEHGAPSLIKRVEAIEKLQHAGWRVGIRIDPIVWHEDYQQNYQSMMSEVFERVNGDSLDSLTLGGFRLPKQFFKIMKKLYPEHWLFHAGLDDQQQQISYQRHIETELFDVLRELSSQYISDSKIYSYPAYEQVSI